MHLRWHPTSFKVFAIPVIHWITTIAATHAKIYVITPAPVTGAGHIQSSVDAFPIVSPRYDIFRSCEVLNEKEETKKRKNVFLLIPAPPLRSVVFLLRKINHISVYTLIWKSKKMLYLCIGEVGVFSHTTLPAHHIDDIRLWATTY